jgi:hypothetical protein
MKTTGNPVRELITVAKGMPPGSRPPRTTESGGSNAAICSAITAKISGRASNRYLSKYSLDT